MNDYNRLCLCDRDYCPFCKAWREEQAAKQDDKAQAKTDILRTKFKSKK